MRLKFIRLIYSVIVLLVILRLAFWQIVSADELSARAEDQRTLKQQVIAPRGNILFADGSVLATSQPMFLLFAQPKVIEAHFIQNGQTQPNHDLLNQYKQNFAQTLADQLTLNLSPLEASTEAEVKDLKQKQQDLILQKLSQNLYWVNLGRLVNLETKQKLEKLNLIGLGFQSETGRYYPEASSSAHLLGFVSKDDYGAQKGYFGAEGFYDGELRGTNGQTIEEQDAMGLPILIGKFFEKEAKMGKTIKLNIDRTIQHVVEQKLADGMQKYGAKGASAIVMDPQTGAILAMAGLPSYDPGNPVLYPKDNFKDPNTTDVYEPGSTFKTVIMSGAINEGKVDDNFRCSICTGPAQIGGFSIHTWNDKYYPNSTISDIIIHSDNVGMIDVSRRMGKDVELKYIKAFGFGKLTNLDVQDEFTPDLRPDNDWKDIDLATASFGQGISVTPIQMVTAVAAIANGGRLLEPHLAQNIADEKGSYEVKPKLIGNPIKPETAKKMTEIMIRAVKEGESHLSQIPGYTIAGKTGTAQVPVAGHYDPSHYIASFVGFAPAENPRFVMLVRYLSPSAAIHGAETAAPTFSLIAREIFNYYGIPPAP